VCEHRPCAGGRLKQAASCEYPARGSRVWDRARDACIVRRFWRCVSPRVATPACGAVVDLVRVMRELTLSQRSEAQLKRDKGGRVWMRHVRHEDLDYVIAGGLARAGKNGRSEYSETVS
jgi:hypothetical protein